MQHLEDVQVLTGQKNRKLENVQSTGVYQGVEEGANKKAHIAHRYEKIRKIMISRDVSNNAKRQVVVL